MKWIHLLTPVALGILSVMGLQIMQAVPSTHNQTIMLIELTCAILLTSTVGASALKATPPVTAAPDGVSHLTQDQLIQLLKERSHADAAHAAIAALTGVKS